MDDDTLPQLAHLASRAIPEFAEMAPEMLASPVPTVDDHDSPLAKDRRYPAIPGGKATYWAINGDAGIDTALPFPINSFIVHNWSAQYAQVQDVFIAPYTYNNVVRQPNATSRARLQWAAPPGITQPTKVTSAPLQVVFFEETLAPAAGLVLTAFPGTGTVTPQAAASTPSNVASSASSVTLLAANTGRKGASVYNDSTQVLFLLLGGNGIASSTNYTLQVAAQGFYELPPPAVFTGLITGIWAAANGAARVSELS